MTYTCSNPYQVWRSIVLLPLGVNEQSMRPIWSILQSVANSVHTADDTTRQLSRVGGVYWVYEDALQRTESVGGCSVL